MLGQELRLPDQLEFSPPFTEVQLSGEYMVELAKKLKELHPAVREEPMAIQQENQEALLKNSCYRQELALRTASMIQEKIV